MPASRAEDVVLVNRRTRTFTEARPKTPHQFDGRGYTLSAKGGEVKLWMLDLTAVEWATIEWFKDSDGAHSPVRLRPERLAADLRTTPTTAKTALARLVKLGLLVKPSPRAGAYQLNPRAFWEGAGSTQANACVRLSPPRVKPDERALAHVAKPAPGKADKPATPRARKAQQQPAMQLVNVVELLDGAEPTPARKTRRPAAERTSR